MKHRFVIFILVALALVGCSRNYSFKRETLSETSPWGFARGDLAGQGWVNIAEFPGRLDIVWETGVPDKPVGPLTIYHNRLIYAGTKKRVRFISLTTGRQLGQFKSRGLAQAGMIFKDSIAYFSVGPKKNQLSAVNLVNQDDLWSNPIKDVSSGSIIVDNRLIVSSGDGRLSAYDLKTGEKAWTFQIRGKFVAPPTFGHGLIFQPGGKSVLYAVSVSDGKEQFRVRAGAPLVSSAAITDLVYFADVSGTIYAADPSDGRVIWRASADGPIWAPPAIANGRVIVGTSSGLVQAFDAESGLPLWTVDCQEVVKAAPLAINSYVLAGTLGGHLLLIQADDGTIVDKKEVSGAIAVSPVTDGRRIYVATQKGRIICFGESNVQNASTIQRDHAENGSE